MFSEHHELSSQRWKNKAIELIERLIKYSYSLFQWRTSGVPADGGGTARDHVGQVIDLQEQLTAEIANVTPGTKRCAVTFDFHLEY
jgi:hypothetical protein